MRPTSIQWAAVLLGLCTLTLPAQPPASQPAKPDIEQLLQMLASEDVQASGAAREAFLEMGPEAAPHVPAIIAALKKGVGTYFLPEVLMYIGPPARAALPVLVERLLAGSSSANCIEAEAIRAIDPKRPQDVADLLKALAAEQATGRVIALIHVSHLAVMERYAANPSIDLPPVVAAIARLLEDPEEPLRRMAVAALGDLERQARPALPALRGRLADPSERVRHGVLEAISHIGGDAATAEAVRPFLRSPEAWYRRQAIDALVACDHGEQTFQTALALLKDDPDASVREAGLEVVDAIDREGTRAIPLMVEILSHLDRPQNAALVDRCAVLLRWRKENAAPAVAALAAVLQRTDGADRWREADVCEALGEICGARVWGRMQGDIDELRDSYEPFDPLTYKHGKVTTEHTDAAAAALAAALGRSAEGSTCDAAARALAYLGPHAAAAVPALIEALPRTAAAAEALGNIGPAAKAAVPKLLALLDDPQTPVRSRENIIRALDGIAPESEQVTPHLIRALGDPDSEYARRYAALALVAKKAHAVPAVAAALADANPDKAEYAAFALGKMGPAAAPALNALVAALEHDSPNVRLNAVRALGAIGPAAAHAVPALARVIERDDGRVGRAAVFALQDIGLDEGTAAQLAGIRLPEGSDLAPDLFELLYRFPDHALTFFSGQPEKVVRAAGPADVLRHLAANADPAYALLRRAVLARDDLPSVAMAYAGDRRFLPILRQRLEKADVYERHLLRACMRACGEPAGKAVPITESNQVVFRPASARGTGDQRRMPPQFFGGHGDGWTWVLVSGTLKTADGRPAVRPRFFDANDRMLLMRQRKDPALVRYDAATGRFCFLTNVFAAYAFGRGDAPEPGPFQTGPAEVIIEADGAEPLTVVFFDEMPEVAITLRPAADPSAATRPAATPPPGQE